MGKRTARQLLSALLVGLACAGCGGGGASRTARTVTFATAGNFPPLTIVGTYSVRGCAADTRTVVQDAALYYAHSTGLPGPADLYYYDLREAYAHSRPTGARARSWAGRWSAASPHGSARSFSTTWPAICSRPSTRR